MTSDVAERESVCEGEEVRRLLGRVLEAVETKPGRGRLELAMAIVLSLATLGSTWCGYQARQWGSSQGENSTAADTAERQAAENTIVGLQIRTLDGLILLEYWRALREDDSKTAETIELHMKPGLRAAVRASIAAGIRENPAVTGPMERPEYRPAEEQEAALQREQAAVFRAAAARAGRHAGAYILLTLVFASVLFFGGIAGTFTERRVRVGLAWIGFALFMATLLMLARLPVWRG